MGKHALTSPKILFDIYDITGDHNRCSLKLTRAELDATVFGNAAKARAGTLPGFEFGHSGLWEAGAGYIDTIIDANLGTTGKILTVSPMGAASGDIAYSSKVGAMKYELGGNVAGMRSFSGAMIGDGTKIIRGTVLGTGAKIATGAGTAYQLGAVSATQYLYGLLQVVAVAGNDTQSLTVKVQSDDAGAFTDPTDRITFTQVTTAASAQWATPVAGAITDDWWRVTWTIANGGAGVSFTLYSIVAIL